MTTKRQTSISKHKTATTRKTVKSPQAFDIIPRSQVRPSTNARPVISSNQPAVADNTMTTPSTAPALNLAHRRMDLTPPASVAAEAEVKPQEPTVATDEPTVKVTGVSVSDLIAKRSAQSEPDSAPEVAVASNEDALNVTAEATPAPDTESSIEAKEAESKVPEDKDKPTPEAAVSADKPAPSIEDIKTPAAKTDDDSVANALKSDDEDQPQEHSQALKDAIKDMDGDGERPHHELYGGKPVIVVHKKHGEMSALAWVLWFIVCVGLAVLIVNFLIDADIIQTTYNVPHTNLL